jgi:hypothetical protein
MTLPTGAWFSWSDRADSVGGAALSRRRHVGGSDKAPDEQNDRSPGKPEPDRRALLSTERGRVKANAGPVEQPPHSDQFFHAKRRGHGT